jgi:hypothetical protein
MEKLAEAHCENINCNKNRPALSTHEIEMSERKFGERLCLDCFLVEARKLWKSNEK